MPQPRPKILTRFTVPTGGWALKWYASLGEAGETAITATVPAGNYYLADDQQSDCFLHALSTVAIIASKASDYNEGPVFWIDEDHLVNIGFEGNDYRLDGVAGGQIKIAWTEEDGDEIAAVLGFDSAADDTSLDVANPIFTGDYQHAYGWYADEDGLLGNDLPIDAATPQAAQSKAISGMVRTQHLGTTYSNFFDLQYLSFEKTFSDGVDYGDAPVYPCERNAGLECWWREARKGTPFRFYRHHRRVTNDAADMGSTSFVGADAVTYTVAARNWGTEPQRWVGALLVLPAGADDGYLYRLDHRTSWYIESNTDNDLTVNAHPVGYLHNANNDPTTFEIYDIRYSTYVLDVSAGEWKPSELPDINRYDYSIKALRYVG